MADTLFIPRVTNIVSTWLNQINRYIFGGATAASIRSLDSTVYTRFRTLGYYTPGDGGGGDYYADPTDTTSADNGGSVFVASDGMRWKLDVAGATEVSAAQFGAVGGNGTQDTAGIVNGNAFAAANGLTFHLPTTKTPYIYNPSALLSVSTRWRGDSQYNTIVNVANSYAGVVLRQLPNAVLDDFTLQTPGLTKTAGSIGVQASAAVIGNQCVNNEIRRVFIRGFDHGLEHQNTYVFHADHLHIESNNEGIYCVPDAGGGLGFITTHTYINCDIGNNVRDVYYNPPNYSNTVTFVGGNISGATGATQQAYFNKVRVLEFIQTYFEGASTIPALSLGDCDYVDISGGYVNNTGGIMVASGSPIRLTCRNVWFTQANDVIKGADGFQSLSMHSCGLPASGSSAIGNWKSLVLENTDYNNVHYTYLARGQAFGFFETFQSGGGTVTPDMNKGNLQRITLTDTTAFGIAVPANIVPGTAVWISVQNSGGATPAITWNAAYKMAGAGTPASGSNRTWQFVYDGSHLYQVGPAPTDIPN